MLVPTSFKVFAAQYEAVDQPPSAPAIMPLPDVITDSGGRPSPPGSPVSQPATVADHVERQSEASSPDDGESGVSNTRQLSSPPVSTESTGRLDKKDMGTSAGVALDTSGRLNGVPTTTSSLPSRSASVPQRPVASASVSDRSSSVSQFPAKADGPDTVYIRTTSVVKSVIELNTGVQHAQPEEFVDLVKVSFCEF